jgi:hypothetical protein
METLRILHAHATLHATIPQLGQPAPDLGALRLHITVPANNFMGETLATAADQITVGG